MSGKTLQWKAEWNVKLFKRGAFVGLKLNHGKVLIHGDFFKNWEKCTIIFV